MGHNTVAGKLIDAVYPELRRIAVRFLYNERAGHTLEPNALVNELWVRLSSGEALKYQDRAHFFAIAAQTMRRVLIDYARARLADKRGAGMQQMSLSVVDGWNPVAQNEDILLLDRALSKLEKADARAACVVELRFFGGLQDEVAQVLGVSTITVKRDWKVARLAARPDALIARQPNIDPAASQTSR
jgi:RNA polymerase sigma-70 factor (ECF subfamily)